MANAATNTKPSLESIVTRYRREVSARLPPARGAEGATPELEVRLLEVDYANFAAIYEALLARAPPEGGGGPALTQMVGAIMDARPARGEGGPQRYLRPMRIREIYFEGGRKARTRYARKEPLVLPYRVPSAAGLAYLVALSSEQEEPGQFSSDEGAIIRVKARVSFPLLLGGSAETRPALEWRVDMTVTRQIAASDALSALPQIVNAMFRTTPPMAASNFLAALGLDDEARPAARELYRYEVEAEFAGPDDSRDLIRPADVTAAAEAVLRLANPEYVREAAMQAEVYRAAQYLVKAPGYLRRFQHELGLKRLLPQALAITRADYRAIYPPRGLYATVKADGTRAIASVHDGRGVVVADALHEFAPRPGAAAARLAPDTIVDGEFAVLARDCAPYKAGDRVFFPFDLIALLGEEVAGDGFERREARLAEAAGVLREAGIPVGAKPYVRLDSGQPADLERDLRALHGAAYPFEVDGLMLVEPGKPYAETANYKWKPAEHNTIDFLARRAPRTVLGQAPYLDRAGHKLHFLFAGISPDMYDALGLRRCPGYADLFGPAAARRGGEPAGANTGSYFPVQFAPSDAPLAYLYQHPDASPLGEIDGKVVEGRCAGACAAAGGGAALVDWEMVRVRADRRRELLSGRYYGNDFHNAELIWLNYVDPFPLAQLWEGPGADYFMRPKTGAYRAQTAVLSFVKTQRIATYKHAAWVVDLGAGKGQDLGRYLEAEVGHLVAVDRDRAALAELVRRKYSYARPARGRARAGPAGARAAPSWGPGPPEEGERRARAATTVHVLAADLGEPHTATLDKLGALGLPRATADAVVCNLAVHYFLASVEAARNFVALARGAVKVGGQVALTALDGGAVHALFEAGGVPEGGSWDVVENDTLKYSLRRLYSSRRLELAGQRIEVLLPFSDGQYYAENLVNVEALTAEFARRGLSRVAYASAAKSIPDFESRNHAVAALLTPGDRQYLGLYCELCFVRDK